MRCTREALCRRTPPGNSRRLVVSLVVGERTADATHTLVRDFRRRTGGRVMRLMTSDEYPVPVSKMRVAA